MDNNKYVPSVNILRDEARNINYIPTPNGNRIVGQIINDFRKGLRAFNIIGAYGTGKSSFLLAIEKSLKGSKPYFPVNYFKASKFGIIKLVGEYRSIIGAFAEVLNVEIDENAVQHILQEIYNRYHDLGKTNPLLAIQIDEFGKFLEYAAQNNAEKELYFIQQLAEFVGNPDRDIFLLTSIHQSLESYAYGLTAQDRQEWTKVKGRFKDITFNEPVDQLLYLAAEHIDGSTDFKRNKKAIAESFDLFKGSKAFTYSEKYAEAIFEKIFPLDILAANILTLSLQKYGQNERSLFSFLESTDHTGLSKFNQAENDFYNICSVYEYLNFNFYSFLSSKYNPDFAAWSSIRAALETVERAFDDNINDLQKLIKVIGLLNIYAANGANIDFKFLEKYALTCVGMDSPAKRIRQLEEKKIIRFRSHSNRFVLYEGTDLDIQTALIEAANKVSEITDVPTLLKKHFDFTPVLTKAYSFETGTPRYFKYIFSEVPVNPVFEQDIDGYINLVFNDKIDFDTVQHYSAGVADAVFFGYYRNAKEIKHLLYEIEKTQQVINENKEDKIAKKELENILVSQQNLLNHYIINNLFGENGVQWSFRGHELLVDSKRTFNRHLSQICAQTYTGTPVFKNELVNRSKLSGSVYSAKKNYFAALSTNWDKPDLGFDPDKFPPEKTIYLSLLRENGLITNNTLGHIVGISEGSTFSALWEISNTFLENSKDRKTNIEELAEILRKRPFRLKQGLVDFWVPTFFFLKRSDFALFSDDGFIPELNAEILDLISKSPKDYYIKAFDIEGVKLDIFNSYRIFLNQQVQDRLSNQSFIETIKPFLVFYRQIPEYSKQTKRLSNDGLAIKNAIANSKEPEKTFFEDFPAALGYSLEQLKDHKKELNAFTISLQAAIKEIRTSYDELIQRMDNFIQSDIVGETLDFEEYKDKLKLRFKSLKRHLLLPHQRTFMQRVDSALDDKRAWLVSISQAVVGKSPEAYRDEDEILFYDKLQKLIFELDSLTKLSAVKVDEEKEDVLGFQFDSFVSGVKQSLIRIPKAKSQKIDSLSEDLKTQLTKDNIVNIAALTKLLQELISK
jgi:hypothetical protein